MHLLRNRYLELYFQSISIGWPVGNINGTLGKRLLPTPKITGLNPTFLLMFYKHCRYFIGSVPIEEMKIKKPGIDICIGWVPHKVPLLTTLRGRAISYLRPGPLGPGMPVVDHIPSRSVHL